MAFADLALKTLLPGSTPWAIATPGIGEEGEFPRVFVAALAFKTPPSLDGLHGKLGGIVRWAAVRGQIMEAIRNRHALGLGTEVAIPDRLPAPAAIGVLESADEFLFLGIEADDRKPLGGKVLAHPANMHELSISLFGRNGTDP